MYLYIYVYIYIIIRYYMNQTSTKFSKSSWTARIQRRSAGVLPAQRVEDDALSLSQLRPLPRDANATGHWRVSYDSTFWLVATGT